MVVGVTIGVGSAEAQNRDPVVADALFREARDLFKANKFEQACPKFAESYRLDPAPGTLFNVAECEEKRGRIASALERWRSLIELLTADGKLTDPRLPVARQHVAALDPRVPRLTLRIKAGSPRETVVLYDGLELRAASLNTELPIEPGEHAVVARAAYRHDGAFKLTVREGEKKELIVEPGSPDGTQPAPPSSAPSSSATTSVTMVPTPTASGAATTEPTGAASDGGTAPPTSWRRPTGLVVAGAGLAALVGAGVTGVMLINRKSTITDHCKNRQCDPVGNDAVESSKTLVPVNLVLWAVGVVGVGAGAYLFVTAPSSPRVGFSADPGGGSVWLHGRF